MKKFSRYIAEKVNEKQIMKDLDSGMSADAVIGKYANKKTTNTDEIRKVIKQHAWNKRMKKEETELSEVSAKMARRAAAASQAKAYTAGSGYQNPEQEKDADRLDRKSQKAMAHVKKRQGEKGVKRVNRMAGKMLGMEETEQIDEISPELAARYHDKAGRDMRKHADNASFARDSLMKDKKNKNLHYTTKKERGDMARKSERKLRNRAIGMSRAGSRMEEIELDEKSVSQAQQKLMGMALAYKRGEMNDASDEVKKLASSMSEKDLEDFAKTKHKGLPKKVEESELDQVDKSQLKKKFDARADKDIDNDGDVDTSDKYLHKRRKAIAKAIAKKTK